ncbi:hypothetical protein EZV62_019280 [Acer yangbiense]|uniref:Retrotransposon Copia-like N-terminal domain-containing protein n=1 Tax=Acer yangbiense TaxID=1000413 RepID=A0A5C7HAQ2_9ROSI|nr:hypothetical protein EZV62_019280 [Acer yangbiense]
MANSPSEVEHFWQITGLATVSPSQSKDLRGLQKTDQNQQFLMHLKEQEESISRYQDISKLEIDEGSSHLQTTDKLESSSTSSLGYATCAVEDSEEENDEPSVFVIEDSQEECGIRDDRENKDSQSFSKGDTCTLSQHGADLNGNIYLDENELPTSNQIPVSGTDEQLMVSEHETASSATAMRGVDATNISTTGLKPLTPLKLELTVRLDHNNFLLWKQQVQAAIKGNRLSAYIDPLISPPSSKNLDGSEYDPFVIPITSMKNCYPMPKITALLLTHEKPISQCSSFPSLFPPTISHQPFAVSSTQPIFTPTVDTTVDTQPLVSNSSSRSLNLDSVPHPLISNISPVTQSVATPPINTHPMITRAKTGIYKPRVWLAELDDNEPSTVQEALSHPKWFEAMKEEFQALRKNQTWSLVEPPSGRKILRMENQEKSKQEAYEKSWFLEQIVNRFCTVHEIVQRGLKSI